MLPFLQSVALTGLLLLVGCRSARSERVYGAYSEEIKSGRFTLLRLDPELADGGGEQFHGYAVLDEGAAIAESDLKTLRRVLLNAGSYGTRGEPRVKPCRFEPVAGFKFGTLDLLLSFACSRIEVYQGGKFLAMRDIDGGHNQILAIMKRCFPKDTYIQLCDDLD